MYQQYILAALALLAAVVLIGQGLRSDRRGHWWFAAAAVAVVPVGLTYSRAALGGLVLAAALLAIGGRARPRTHALAVAVLLLGAGIPALLTLDGWITQSGKGLELNGRDVLVREGLDLFASAPLTGIGIALEQRERERPGSVELLQPTHGVPILMLIEGGVQSAVLCSAVIALMAWRARRSWVALAVLGAYLPFVLLDHFPYTHAQGLILSAIWLGAVEVLARQSLPGATQTT
jgi:O-antigen ligase